MVDIKAPCLVDSSEMSNAQYHTAPGVSSSILKGFHSARTPKHFITNKDKMADRALQGAFDLGTALHTAILEPEKFQLEIAVFDDTEVCFKIGGSKPRATKSYQAWRADFEAENAGKAIITGENAMHLSGMRKSLSENTYFTEIMSAPGRAEASLFFCQDYSDLLCKCRPDFLRNDGYVLDLKTTQDASYAGFSKQILNLGYHIQAAHYLDGVKTVMGNAQRFIFVAVETTPPYGVAFHSASDDMLAVGRSDARVALEGYSKCMKADEWPCYPMRADWIDLPGWMKGVKA